jgi:hypothetical protein
MVQMTPLLWKRAYIGFAISPAQIAKDVAIIL